MLMLRFNQCSKVVYISGIFFGFKSLPYYVVINVEKYNFIFSVNYFFY